GALELQTMEQEVSAGQTVVVPVTAANFDAMLGYQFTMRTRGLELTEIAAGVLDVTDQNVGIHAGAITMSWHTAIAVSASAEEVLFTLTFTAVQPGILSDMLAIGSRITTAEAYATAHETGESVLDVSLAFEDGITPDNGVEYALYQNEPNPFDNATVIGFTLPEAMDATLTMFDVTGKVVREVEGTYHAGYNEIRVKQDDLGTTGMIYYRLDAGDFTATKKMIIVK
ncbi:MAG: T9SS type A sorting domain-containing protein, partial [Saprospiraceae bacterium]|nr:T9SS type A sorting domain-containing protein [Saprospiraceae bacterium]